MLFFVFFCLVVLCFFFFFLENKIKYPMSKYCIKITKILKVIISKFINATHKNGWNLKILELICFYMSVYSSHIKN